MIRNLTTEDINEIIDVESRAFIPPLQAAPATILHRFDLNHILLGAEVSGRLVGTLGFRYGTFSGLLDFPKSFEDYASHPSEKGNAMFGYSFGFVPQSRPSTSPYRLAAAMLERSKQEGIEHVLAVGRCPSYNGSNAYSQEAVDQNPQVREEINRCLAQNALPSKDVLKKDPIMRFYIELFDPQIAGILPGFFQGDIPSGGLLILLYKNMMIN